MDPRRLRLLLELSRLGSMRAVGEQLGYTTSTVSQQLSVLAGEAGTPLLERMGREVRLTPAGRRLADHAITILAAIEAARIELDPTGEPSGTVRVAGFATSLRAALLPVVHALAARHPAVELHVREHEPPEAIALLADDEVDLAIVYDYNLAPYAFPDTVNTELLWTAPWHLAVRTGHATRGSGLSPDILRRYGDADWIVNSRYNADETVLRSIAALSGFVPRITHRVDSLELVQELVAAGLGVGLLPADGPLRDGVDIVALHRPEALLRSYALTRRGREGWAPLALVSSLLRQHRPSTAAALGDGQDP